MICPNCNISNLDYARFCQECGAELGSLQTLPPESAVVWSEVGDQDLWKKAAALKEIIPVYALMDPESPTVAEIEPEEKFYLGEPVKDGNKSWVPVLLINGQEGFIDGDVNVLSEVRMARDISSWGIALLIIGTISIFLAEFLDPLWGVLLVCAGIVALVVKKRFMFIVFGVVLLLAGIMNITVGGGWAAFGILQGYWGVTEIIKYFKYNAIEF